MLQQSSFDPTIELRSGEATQMAEWLLTVPTWSTDESDLICENTDESRLVEGLAYHNDRTIRFRLAAHPGKPTLAVLEMKVDGAERRVTGIVGPWHTEPAKSMIAKATTLQENRDKLVRATAVTTLIGEIEERPKQLSAAEGG